MYEQSHIRSTEPVEPLKKRIVFLYTCLPVVRLYWAYWATTGDQVRDEISQCSANISDACWNRYRLDKALDPSCFTRSAIRVRPFLQSRFVGQQWWQGGSESLQAELNDLVETEYGFTKTETILLRSVG